MSNIPSSENSYAIDQESAIEMARLVDQDHLLTRHMGGLFPTDFALSGVHDILDVACGPGGWALEVAFAYPEKQVLGVDISKAMLNYAAASARRQRLNNARFRFMDATAERLDFPDASFDFVNARFLAGFMWKEAWPQLIRECVRITRPGGTVRFTETDTACIGMTNSLALEKMARALGRSIYRTGRSFGPDEQTTYIGITPRLRFFFQQAGCEAIQEQAFLLNYSAGTDAHMSNYQNLQVVMKLLQPFVQKTGSATEEEWEHLYQQMLVDMSQENFCGIWYFLSVYGQKPA